MAAVSLSWDTIMAAVTSREIRSRTRRLLERGDRAKTWNETGVLSEGKISLKEHCHRNFCCFWFNSAKITAFCLLSWKKMLLQKQQDEFSRAS